MQRLVWILVALLVVLQQDYWQWGNAELLFGFLPFSLAWHAGVSLAAAGVWWLATHYCWPTEARAPQPPGGSGESAS